MPPLAVRPTSAGASSLAGVSVAGTSGVRKAVVVVAASVFVAMCAHVSVPLPFTPVPVVLSDFAVMLVGLLLGPSIAFAALALYLLEGALGMPVFSPVGLPGLAHLLSPTAGYLLAYPAAAAVAGGLHRKLSGLLGEVAASTCAAAGAATLILLSGAVWLQHWMYLGAATAWALAVAPFLVGSGVKVVAAVSVANAWNHLRSA